MPAATADVLTLPRLSAAADARPRTVRSVTTAPMGLEGEGFPVHRAFAGVHPSDLDPFIHMDQMGEVEYGAGEPKGTPWHPHRGFETFTYLIDGQFVHQDSNGGGGMILDMMPHYFYMLEAMGGRPLDVVCSADTLVKKRWDEKGNAYNADADDSLPVDWMTAAG